jgi:hypothetical protein
MKKNPTTSTASTRLPTTVATWLIATCAAIALSASGAYAQCAFNTPGKAKTLKSDLVRAYSACPSITFAAPNTSTETSTPACGPPVPLSNRFFDSEKGKCTIKSKAKVETPCKDGAVDSCMNVKIKAKCTHLLLPDGMSPENAGGWTLNTISRATFDDPLGGDMTVVDFPAKFDFPQAKNGKIKLKADTNSLLAGLFGAGSNLPACAYLEILGFSVVDPNGNVFAKQGVGAKP